MALIYRRSTGQRRQMALVGALALATLVCMAQLAVRALYARQAVHFYLVWNLFLAWLPMLSALIAYNVPLLPQRRWLYWLLLAPCVIFWLLFFPNAPYILTDIMHLRPLDGVPLWYDLILLVSAAWTGSFLGLASLYLMHLLVRRAAGARAGWLFAAAAVALCGFGVYLGRFPGWNSWDVLTDPTGLLLSIAMQLRHPLANAPAFVFSALLAISLGVMYLMLVAIIEFRPVGD